MLLQLPRLTNSLRYSFDADQAYLQRKKILQTLINHRSSANSFDESELARKIVYRWDEGSSEVRQAYKKFVGVVVELIDGEVVSEEFREVGLAVYRLFTASLEEEGDPRINEKKLELKNLLGHVVSDALVRKVASAVQRLSSLQPNCHEAISSTENEVNGEDDVPEFGADLVFCPPSRFLIDDSLEDGDLLGDADASTFHSISLYAEWNEHGDSTNYQSPVVGKNFDLGWLRDACQRIVDGTTSQLPHDELAMAICRVLDSDKPGDEIAGDLLDLVGYGALETVQDLITHRKELVDAIHHGMLVLKSDKAVTSSQSRMPSYGTQVTVQAESEKQIDKLRRKEEKKNRRGADHGTESDMSVHHEFQFSTSSK